MVIDILTDEKIAELISMRKEVTNTGARAITQDGCIRRNYYAKSSDGEVEFTIYTRQNIHVEDDFSCGISITDQSGKKVTLIRYNGSHHSHGNKIEKEELGFVCHIHRATERYIQKTRKADSFATATTDYSTLSGALFVMINDCAITGISSPPDQDSLFGAQ